MVVVVVGSCLSVGRDFLTFFFLVFRFVVPVPVPVSASAPVLVDRVVAPAVTGFG